jgi:hypothetical protein
MSELFQYLNKSTGMLWYRTEMSDARMSTFEASALMPMPSHGLSQRRTCLTFLHRFLLLRREALHRYLYWRRIILPLWCQTFRSITEWKKKLGYLNKEFQHCCCIYRRGIWKFHCFFTVYYLQSTFIWLFQQHLLGCRYSIVLCSACLLFLL